MTTAAEIFGGNSDGGMRMMQWLDVMCRGCIHGQYEKGIGYGVGCELPGRAICDPYTADIPEWSIDAPWPERFADEFEPGEPWPVCMSYDPRKKRSDAGLKRGPRPLAGQLELT